MKKLISGNYQMNALHDALAEQFPNAMAELHVEGLDGQWVSFTIETPPPGMSEAIDKITLCAITASKIKLALNETTTVAIEAPNQNSVAYRVYEYGNVANALAGNINLTNGSGTFTFSSDAAGKFVIETVGNMFLARCRIEVN